MNYNTRYFIEKFEATTEDEWCVHIQQNNIHQRCAFGHCMPLAEKSKGYMDKGYGHSTDEGMALAKIFSLIYKVKEIVLFPYQYYSVSPAAINNGENKDYQQETPRQRVLAALYDIAAWEAVQEAEKIISETKNTEQHESKLHAHLDVA